MKLRTKLMAGIITLGLIGSGYMISQHSTIESPAQSSSTTQDADKSDVTSEEAESLQGNEEEQSISAEGADEVESQTAESQEQSEVASEREQVVTQRLEEAVIGFEQDGMNNLYTSMSKREKKKWLKRINEGGYIEGDASLQYQISGIYEIGENQYYILGWSADGDGRLTVADSWSESQRETYEAKEVFELILMQEEDSFFATQAIYPSEAILTSDEVALYKKQEQENSNVAIEYNRVQKLDGLDEYVDYLDEAIQELNEEVINDTGKSEVTQYVQYAIEDLSSEQTVAEDNIIEIKEEVLEQMKETISSAKDRFSDLLSQSKISFNKSLNTILRLQTQQVSFKKPVYVQLPISFENVGEVTGLRVLIDETSYVYIDGADLEALAGLKIKIERHKDKSTYEITFLNDQDEVISQLDQSVTFALPAKDELTTVIANYGEETQNWGGQYDASTSTIAFGTKYSGKYQVVDNQVKIKDISTLTSSQQAAIKFMVSKGYLSLENDHFYPNVSFTRYEFSEALVKMFFALDKSLETSFKDVDKSSEYYPYVASGETYEIIKGYVDQTFRGEVKIPAEQVISLCARTIADKKGYVYPSYVEEYIKFADAEEISKWAVNDIALAVQSGLIKGGGSLSPKSEITKAESAEILYNLFMLLYETSPGQVIDMNSTQKTYSILGVIIILLVILSAIKRFIKRNKVVLTMIACTIAIIVTMMIGFKGGF